MNMKKPFCSAKTSTDYRALREFLTWKYKPATYTITNLCFSALILKAVSLKPSLSNSVIIYKVLFVFITTYLMLKYCEYFTKYFWSGVAGLDVGLLSPDNPLQQHDPTMAFTP